MSSGKGKGIMDELLRAARKTARSQPTPSGRKKTERDLLKMLEAHRQDTEHGRAGKVEATSPFSIPTDQKPGRSREQFTPKPSKPDFGERDVSPEPRQQPSLTILKTLLLEKKGKMASQKESAKFRDLYNLTSGPALGIFSYKEMKQWPAPKPGILETWDKLQAQELKALYTQAPRNAFEEWIQWTEQGKLWKFPIDNEQGIDEEKNVPFTEHIFLESWLEGLPERGPVRQFMELLLLGLSNNPYITVERKRETFDWFKKYFEHEKSILEKAGVL